jgi:hypothetical protein
VLSASSALSLARLSPVALTSAEARTFAHAEFLLTAACAEIVWAATRCVAVCDAGAAMCCEAMAAPESAFDNVYFDLCRPHRGMSTSAGNLRLMLEGSKTHASVLSGAKSSESLSSFRPISRDQWRDAVASDCFGSLPSYLHSYYSAHSLTDALAQASCTQNTIQPCALCHPYELRVHA